MTAYAQFSFIPIGFWAFLSPSIDHPVFIGGDIAGGGVGSVGYLQEAQRLRDIGLVPRPSQVHRRLPGVPQGLRHVRSILPPLAPAPREERAENRG